MADSIQITIALEVAFGLILLSTDVVNECKNTILNEEQMPCTHSLTFCVEWFRSRCPTITLPDTKKNRLVVQVMSALQGAKPAGKQWNDRFSCDIKTLGTKLCASSYEV